MQATERINGKLSANFKHDHVEIAVLLDVVRVTIKNTDRSIFHLELVQSSDVPDSGPYLLRYTYGGKEHEVLGLYVADGKFQINPIVSG